MFLQYLIRFFVLTVLSFFSVAVVLGLFLWVAFAMVGVDLREVLHLWWGK